MNCKLERLVGAHIKEAWVEDDTDSTQKLCVRYSDDTGAETFGCFRATDEVRASDFVGLSADDACKKFNAIVYPNRC